MDVEKKYEKFLKKETKLTGEMGQYIYKIIWFKLPYELGQKIYN